MNGPTPPTPQPPPGVLTALVDAVSSVAQRLKEQIYLFIIVVGLLIILAFIASLALQTFAPLYVTIAALVVLALAALLATRKSTHRSVPPEQTKPDFSPSLPTLSQTVQNTPAFSSASEPDNEILALKHRKLHELKKQQALKGVSTPPEVLIEIEEIEKELRASGKGS